MCYKISMEIQRTQLSNVAVTINIKKDRSKLSALVEIENQLY